MRDFGFPARLRRDLRMDLEYTAGRMVGIDLRYRMSGIRMPHCDTFWTPLSVVHQFIDETLGDDQ